MSENTEYEAELKAKFPEFKVKLIEKYNNREYTFELKADGSNLAFAGQLNRLRNKGFIITYIDFMEGVFHAKISKEKKED